MFCCSKIPSSKEKESIDIVNAQISRCSSSKDYQGRRGRSNKASRLEDVICNLHGLVVQKDQTNIYADNLKTHCRIILIMIYFL